MRFNELNEKSQRYVKEYVRKTGKTIEEALRIKIVQEVIKEYEHPSKEFNY